MPSEHTPGPWSWARNDNVDADGSQEWACTCLWSDAVRGGYVIQPSIGIDSVNENNLSAGTLRVCLTVDKADGRLIAAAPELLEACRTMLRWAENPPELLPPGHTCSPEGNCDCDCMAHGYLAAARIKVRAAIAKATKGE